MRYIKEVLLPKQFLSRTSSFFLKPYDNCAVQNKIGSFGCRPSLSAPFPTNEMNLQITHYAKTENPRGCN